MLDRIGAKPYCGRAISTPKARLPIALAFLASPRVLDMVAFRSAFGNQPVQKIQPAKGNVMSKSKFRPLHDRVVVKRIDAEEKTKGGIIIPDSAKEKPSQGEVTAVGPGGRDEAGKLIPIDIKVGDRVLFGKWSGTEVKLDGEELLIMKESDIMGVKAGDRVLFGKWSGTEVKLEGDDLLIMKESDIMGVIA